MRVTRTWAKIPRTTPFHRQLSTESHRCRQVIAERNAAVNAFAQTSDVTPTTSTATLPLSGRPIAIKDNICTKAMGTTCSSNMLKDFNPPYDATVVRLLRAAGADIIGKTNCDEFGMGSMNIHSIHGPVSNPFKSASSSSTPDIHVQRSAGGSSGGSAAAVAAGMCNAALATDTGGSTRLPASYCGVVGLKPSYGLISRWGVVSFADSLDCVGVMAASVADTRRVFEVLNVHDPKDPTAASSELRREAGSASAERRRQWDGAGAGSLGGLRIGVPQEYFPSELSPAIIQPIRRTLAALQARGATLVPVSLPATAYALSAYYVLASAEASSNMGRYDGVQYGLHVRPPPGADLTKTAGLYARSRSAGFGPEVKRRILLGTYALTADAFDNYFLQAQRVRQRVKDDFERVFRLRDVSRLPVAAPASAPARENGNENGNEEGVDVLVHASAIRTAPALTERSGLDAYVQDVLTVPASLAGLPALSVPVPGVSRGVGGVSRGSGVGEEEEDGEDGWPMGISVVGQWGCDETVLRVGEVIEGLGEGEGGLV